MAKDETEVVVVGGGAAGVAAARRLNEAGVDCLLIEARSRLGGRAWVRFDLGAEPLAMQWQRRARQALLKHFNPTS